MGEKKWLCMGAGRVFSRCQRSAFEHSSVGERKWLSFEQRDVSLLLPREGL